MLRLRDALYELYWKLEKLIVPGLRNSQYLYKEILESSISPGSKWLELGCGHQILPAWMHSSREIERALIAKAQLTVGLDRTLGGIKQHPTISSRVVGDTEKPPFADGCFDIVTANMVMEHVEDPKTALREVHRLLRAGGVFVFHTTNIHNYKFALASLIPQRLKNKLIEVLEGRQEDDVFPTVYKINTPKAIKTLARDLGFNIVELKMVNSTAATVVVLPAALFELFMIRLLEHSLGTNYRSNIIVVLQKKLDHEA
jgi:ubiquinone/menaquinone biosynthesis C-methylase UbiE